MIDRKKDNERYRIDYSLYQKTGSKHREQREPNQDSWLYSKKKGVVVCGLADGQSCCTHSDIGASSSLNQLTEYIHRVGIDRLSAYEYADERQHDIAKQVRNELGRLAEKYNISKSEFGSTIVLIAMDVYTGKYASIHLGDGIIIGVQKDGTITHISSPENGLFPNSTWLTTSRNMSQHIRVSFGSIKNLQRIIIATDGAQYLACGGRISALTKRYLAVNGSHEMSEYIKSFDSYDDASVMDLSISLC